MDSIPDTIIRGGRVIDPANGRDEVADVAIAGDEIMSVGEHVTEGPDTRIIDAGGRVVIPGMIDLHTHIYGGIGLADPDTAGVRAGVTTVIDAGSSGAASFRDLLAVSVPNRATDIYCILFLEPPGALDFRVHAKPHELDAVRYGDMVQLAEEHPDRIKGVKAAALSDLGLEWSLMAKEVSRRVGGRAYYHVGNFRRGSTTAPHVAQLLDRLDASDIITHCYSAQEGALLDEEGAVLPGVRDAVERGVVLDLGHGGTGFNWDVATRMLDAGINPTTISSDLNVANVTHPVGSLAEVISKVLALGIALPDVVAMVTANPARVMNLGDRGALTPGRLADVTVLEIETGDFSFVDADGEHRDGTQRVRPELTVKRGELFDIDLDAAGAPENRKFHVVTDDVPAAAGGIGADMAPFLRQLGRLVGAASWRGEDLHYQFHDLVDRLGVDRGRALAAVYSSFSERTTGPQLGWWLAKLAHRSPDLVEQRLAAVADRVA